jgi:hypothetical protein
MVRICKSLSRQSDQDNTRPVLGLGFAGAVMGEGLPVTMAGSEGFYGTTSARALQDMYGG